MPGRMNAMLEFGIELARPAHVNVGNKDSEFMLDVYLPQTDLD